MTKEDLQRGNELNQKIKELSDNIKILDLALTAQEGKIKRFAFSCKNKNEIHIDGDCISFGGFLKVDRELMELLQNYFENKREEARKEFENIGKDEEHG